MPKYAASFRLLWPCLRSQLTHLEAMVSIMTLTTDTDMYCVAARKMTAFWTG